MLLTLHTNDSESIDVNGTLYVVATPIGNMKDITLRAIDILGKVDLVAAEDTRHTGKLLSFYGIRAKLISVHEHNERQRTPALIDRLKTGGSVAVVSDAGTPSVSDPGFRLVNAAIENDIKIVPVPGVSAPIAALSVSGLPTDSFVFAGFLSRKKKKRLADLTDLAREPRTLVFYESPKRILRLLEEIMATMGERYGVAAREMTKHYEEFIRGRLSEIHTRLKDRPQIKGELTLLVAGCEKNENVSILTVREEIRKMLGTQEEGLSGLSKTIAKKYSLPKKKVYEEALKLKRK